MSLGGCAFYCFPYRISIIRSNAFVLFSLLLGEGTTGKLLKDESLYSNVNQLLSESVKLIYDFRQNPKKYLTIKFQMF
jgi:phospholipid/cholesterol/gamma-HCH transport system substrate-binding protein